MPNKMQKKHLFTFLIIYIWCVIAAATKDAFHEDICKSATIRTIKDFNQLQNCTVIAGHVRIVQMQFSLVALEQVKPSNIEEISEYLLVYRVEGLDSLERLFPKLIIIRGIELLYDQYALIVLENRDLQNIGLISLLRVLKGSINIESNPSLCFTHTINWVSILGNDTKQYHYVLRNNKSPNQCPLCYTYKNELRNDEEERHLKCWSLGKLQKTSLDFIGDNECNKERVRSSCLTSCYDHNCRHCTNYVSDVGCMGNCLPPKYKMAFKRECVSDCSHYGLVQLGMKCVEKCPKGYQVTKTNGIISCALDCRGNFQVHHLEDLEGLADCTTIDGSLTLELHDLNKNIVPYLEQAFRNLNEITGYLKILNSPQIIALHFFKNLHTIRGLELLENRYSLYVVDNLYLEDLWPGNVAILHGCVYFHLNPLLCYEKITDLQKICKECKDVTVKDASQNSNGERAVCGEDVRIITTNITDINSNAAIVELELLLREDFFLIIGFIYYYKEARYKNVTKFDGRHGCGRDDWFTDVIITQRRRHIFKNLKPGTQYAYFVRSMTTIDYPYQVEHASEIGYFQTQPAKPGKVAKMYTHSLSANEIEVHWWPPRIANGIVEKYILQYEVTDETTAPETSNIKDKNEHCQCPKLDSESHIPSPHVDNYLNKEQQLYKDAFTNFVYRKRSKPAGNTQQTERTERSEQQSGQKVQTVGKTRFWNSTEEELAEYISKQLEKRIIQRQEEAKETYILSHPYPICSQSNPNTQDQTENKCMPLERFEDAIEVPSHLHSYVLNNLKPEKTYRISMRACVKDLPNGCGDEKVILAKTVSKRLETLLGNLTFHLL